jgi:Uma2 family endonuclease
MRPIAAPSRMTFSEYLRSEAASNTKHEFLDGQVYAMAGGTPEHARIAANVIRELGSLLAGGACREYTSDLRVRVLATGLTTYPDVTIVCGSLERDVEDANTITNPTVIVEVLSDSTEAYDRGEKFHHYQRIPSLRAYVLVSQREARIEVFERAGARRWTFEDVRAPDAARIEVLGCSLPVAAAYNGVEVPLVTGS